MNKTDRACCDSRPLLKTRAIKNTMHLSMASDPEVWLASCKMPLQYGRY
tara:strand:+ start:123107 stop:123253 length:147 start_codon:yes stop_codon:yes gene_type:complete